MGGDLRAHGDSPGIRELIEAARRMTDGEFQQLAKIEARGELGELAGCINQIMQNLQQLDPAVGMSWRKLPQMTGHLSEVVQTTEQASLKVLDEIDRLVEEHAAMAQQMQQLATLLQADPTDRDAMQPTHASLKRLKELHGRAQERALKIMGAMEFQDIAAQRIQKSIASIAEIRDRLMRLLMIFNIPTAEEECQDMEARRAVMRKLAVASESVDLDQEMVDRVLAEFGRKTQ